MPMRNYLEFDALLDSYFNNTEATAALIVDWVRLAEKRIVREFAINGMQDKFIETKSYTSSSGTLAEPLRCRSVEVVYIDANPKTTLSYLPPDEFFSRYAATQTGTPLAYTRGAGKLHLGPAPDGEKTFVIWFRKEPDISSVIDQNLIPEMDETDYDNSPTSEGTFAGGTGHAADDKITLANGSEVLVTSVSGGVVDGFRITSKGGVLDGDGTATAQSSTTGSGTGFSLSPEADNVAPTIFTDHPELYLYATLAEGFGYLNNQIKEARYQQLFNDAIADLQNEAFNSGRTGQMIWNSRI